MELQEVKVRNSEINTDYKLYVRPDRLEAFKKECKNTFILHHREWSIEQVGVDGAAVVGLNAIFNHIPNKFPVIDLLRFLAKEAFNDPNATQNAILDVTEYFLIRFGQKYPGIRGDGEDV